MARICRRVVNISALLQPTIYSTVYSWPNRSAVHMLCIATSMSIPHHPSPHPLAMIESCRMLTQPATPFHEPLLTSRVSTRMHTGTTVSGRGCGCVALSHSSSTSRCSTVIKPTSRLVPMHAKMLSSWPAKAAGCSVPLVRQSHTHLVVDSNSRCVEEDGGWARRRSKVSFKDWGSLDNNDDHCEVHALCLLLRHHVDEGRVVHTVGGE